VEEVARIHGLDEHLPATLPGLGERVGALTVEQRLRRRAEDVLRDLGFDEVVTWSFVAPDAADRLRLPAADPRRRQVTIQNPLSADQSVMRTALVGGLCEAAARNLARGAGDVRLFESGRAYLSAAPPGDGGPAAGAFAGDHRAPAAEPHRLAGLIVGSLTPGSWRDRPRGDDGDDARFYELKGVVEALLSHLGVAAGFAPGSEPFLRPGRAAAVSADGTPAGWLGELHPATAAAWDLPAAAAFELDLAPLVGAAIAAGDRYRDVTTYPPVVEDIAVVVGEEVPAERVRALVVEAAGELLRDAQVFDVYRGDQVGAGRKSLALRLRYQAGDRTLTDEEVAASRAAVTAALEAVGGGLRG
jgi:phenylalanyl-tRNA synthetase beta chain